MAGKRGDGEGTIRQRKEGLWEALYSYRDEAGNLKRRSLYAKTQREVSEKLRAALAILDKGEAPITEKQTVAQFLDRWLADVVRPNVRPKTHDSYSQVVRLYLSPMLGRHQLVKLTPQHVQGMMNTLLTKGGTKKTGISPRTVQYARAVLRKALGQALKWGLVGRNVATLVDPPKSERYEMRALTPQEAGTFLEAVRGDRLEALYAVAVALGLRQGEICGLRWEDVDFERRQISVRKQAQRIGGKAQLVDLKTRQSRRTIALPKVIAAQLRAHKIRQNEERLQAGERWQNWELVFPSTIGTPLEPSNLTKRYKSILKGAGLPTIRFHDLRHSCASLLIAQGIPARTVMETLGHSQITLTLNTYAHIFPEVQRQAADAMDRLFETA